MRDGLQHRHELLPPDLDEGVLAGAAAPGPVLLARQYRMIRLDPAPVRSSNPARAAAAARLYPSLRESIYRLTWWSVVCLPGINVPPDRGGNIERVVSEPSDRPS